MANLEYCCNPFKKRNHNPEPWRVLPVTESLREQFYLYLGDDTDICLSCKRKLYCTLPSVNGEEALHDSLTEEIEEAVSYWSDDMEMEQYELNEAYENLSAEKHYLAYQLAEERQADLEESQQEESNSEDISETEAVSETEKSFSSNAVTHQDNSLEATEMIESTENYANW